MKKDKTDFAKNMVKFGVGMERLKRLMMSRKLTRAWTKCPLCQSRVDAILRGPKNHIHAVCQGCSMMMME